MRKQQEDATLRNRDRWPLGRGSGRLLLLSLLVLGTADGARAQATGGAGAEESTALSSSVLIIEDVGVVDARNDRVLEGSTVVIEGDRIVAVGSAIEVPASAERVDGAGQYLIPGLWDLHVHLPGSFTPSLAMPLFVAHGVTGVRVMSSGCSGEQGSAGCLDLVREWRGRIERGELLGPRLLAVSSRPLTTEPQAEVPEKVIRARVAELQRVGVDLLKTSHRLSVAAFGWALDEANARELAVGGHIPLSVSSIEASKRGLRSLEHARDLVFDCFPGREAFRATTDTHNPATTLRLEMIAGHDQDACREVFRTFVENDTWYVPTHVTRRMEAFAGEESFLADERTRLVHPQMLESWRADARRVVERDPSPEGRAALQRFYELGLEITGRAHAAGVGVLLGTDAGDSFIFYGSSVHDELEELVKAGLSPAEALVAATLRPAAFLGLEDQYGTVEAGRVADLVLLDGNPLRTIGKTRSIRGVVFAGRYLPRSELDGLVEGVAEAVAKEGQQ